LHLDCKMGDLRIPSIGRHAAVVQLWEPRKSLDGEYEVGPMRWSHNSSHDEIYGCEVC
jgi:hypothetical protein